MKNGISLITLIITIIVIIILAAVVIFTGLNTPERASLAKFMQEVADYDSAVRNDYSKRKMRYATEGNNKSDAQIFYMIARGTEIEGGESVASEVATKYLNGLYKIQPEGLSGKEVFEVGTDSNIEGFSKQKSFYEAEEKHYITDVGETFILPGYPVENEDGTTRWYVNATKYYEGEPVELATSISVWDGSTEEVPGVGVNNEFKWEIYTPAQLKFLANFVNNGNTLTSEQTAMVNAEGYDPASVTIVSGETVVYLMANLDMGARPDTTQTEVEDQWETEENEAVKWEPIGPTMDVHFEGIFEGNYHSITGLYVNDNESYSGLFGTANTIQHLTVKNSYVHGGPYFAGVIAGVLRGTMENCNNPYTFVKGEYTVGGFVGLAYSGCIYYCNNEATVKGVESLGGIVGTVNRKGEISHCINKMNIDGGETVTIGGIIGTANGKSTISYCINKGDIKSRICGGGISGIQNTSMISDCDNYGSVEVKERLAGGIASNVYNQATISNCKNNGIVKTGAYSGGGVAGDLFYNSHVTNCCNNADVIVSGMNAGGIAGRITFDTTTTISSSSIEACYNKGNISGDSRVGGIVGGCYSYTETHQTIINCYNKGDIIGNGEIGEVIGFYNANPVLSNLYYLERDSSLGYAISNVADDPTTKKITHTTADLTYEQFKTWITQQ